MINELDFSVAMPEHFQEAALFFQDHVSSALEGEKAKLKVEAVLWEEPRERKRSGKKRSKKDREKGSKKRSSKERPRRKRPPAEDIDQEEIIWE